MRQSGEPSRAIAVVALLLLAACAPATTPPAAPVPVPGRTPAAPTVGLPPIPAAEAPLAIRVIHPRPQDERPNVDSTYVYGTLGTGRATLTINGTPVPVAPNGAFLAYLPLPASGAYELVARAGAAAATSTAAFRARPPAAPPGAPVQTVEVSPARIGVVTGGADTLASGSEVTVGRPTPGGTYRWFLPRGARVRITGRRGDQLRAQLDTTTAWLPASAVTLGDAAGTPGTVPSTRAAAAVSIAPAAGWVDVRIAADGAPFLVQADSDRLLLSVHDRTAGPLAPPAPDALLAGIRWSSTDPAQLELRFARPLWGYKAFYAQNGDLVLRVRRPPAIDPAAPLRGIRIVVDPGHPPAGAIGPTGLTEAEANLTIGLELAKQLRARGAEVLLTRTTGSAVSITDRVEMAVRSDAQLLVSVHNNAFAEGVNPFRNHGTSAYYFHPFSAGLSQALDREIASATLIPDLGSKWSNLALVRPTWMPSALTESLYMLIPEQEAALRDPGFVERLAAAHVRGMEEFLRGATR